MSDEFNLTTEPWIPCERLDGTFVELSTHDTLVQAHELRAITDPSPLVIAVLYRHLLAVLHRVYDGPKSMKAWSAIARPGRFDAGLVDAYLARVRDRMDMFHPVHPFGQTRGLVEQFGEYFDPIDQLAIERSAWGGARALFQHRPNGYQASMSPAEAARALLLHHSFATGGLVKKPNEPTSATASPLVRSAVVLLRGDSLFRTLIANLLRYDPTNALPIPGQVSDAPAWEQPPPPRQLRRSDEPKRLPMGWLDLLTWQSRRIELVRVGDQFVSFVRAVGQGMEKSDLTDPMVSYRRDEERGLVPLGVNPARAFWRDANALFESGRSGKFMRPKAIDAAYEPEVIALLGEEVAYTVELFGLAAEKSRLDTVRVERVWARARHFSDDDARDVVTRSLGVAEDVVKALGAGLRSYARHLLSEGERTPEGKDIGALATSLNAESSVWSALGVEFDSLLRGLDGDKEEAHRRFATRAVFIARDAFARSVAGADGTARSLKAAAKGKSALEQALAAIQPKPSPELKEVHS